MVLIYISWKSAQGLDSGCFPVEVKSLSVSCMPTPPLWWTSESVKHTHVLAQMTSEPWLGRQGSKQDCAELRCCVLGLSCPPLPEGPESVFLGG